MPIFVVVAAAFKIWMLVDAMKRVGCRSSCNNYWLWIILFIPFGDVAYFFMFKIHDPEFLRIKKKITAKRVTLEQLRYNAQHSPSVHNKTILAQALYDAGKPDDALRLFEEVSRFDARDKDVLYGRAMCHVSLRNASSAIASFEELIQIDPSFRDYDPALQLAGLYWEGGAREKAVELLKKVNKKTQRLQLSTVLARYLIQLNQKEEARELLSSSLTDFNHAPKFLKRVEKPFASEAQSLLKSIGI